MAAPALEQLLLVQERDTRLDQLRHRRATLPERAELATVESERSELAAALTEAEAAAAAAARRQADIEAELAATEARLAELDKRLYSGTVSASRDLVAMTEEIESLKHRRSTLEDRVLEAMDEREPLDATAADLIARQAARGADVERLQAALAAAEAELDAEIAGEAAARAELAATVPQSLGEQYDRLRARLGGTGAARVVHGSCGGCHLSLPATELDRIRRAAEDAVLTCEQCGRILVP